MLQEVPQDPRGLCSVFHVKHAGAHSRVVKAPGWPGRTKVRKGPVSGKELSDAGCHHCARAHRPVHLAGDMSDIDEKLVTVADAEDVVAAIIKAWGPEFGVTRQNLFIHEDFDGRGTVCVSGEDYLHWDWRMFIIGGISPEDCRTVLPI